MTRCDLRKPLTYARLLRWLAAERIPRPRGEMEDAILAAMGRVDDLEDAARSLLISLRAEIVSAAAGAERRLEESCHESKGLARWLMILTRRAAR